LFVSRFTGYLAGYSHFVHMTNPIARSQKAPFAHQFAVGSQHTALVANMSLRFVVIIRCAVTALSVLLYFTPIALGSPLPQHQVNDVPVPESFSRLSRRQEDPTIAVTGIQYGRPQPRLEIRQLEADPDQWNIFLLGLRRFQQTDQSNITVRRFDG
jgi:hypothetical protein